MTVNKKGRLFEGSLSYDRWSLLCRFNSVYRADISAGPAVGADVRINHIDITFGDSFNRALVYAGATSSTIVSNFISHIK
jgi:hypothetical protein